jgi:hypothetical protein
VHRSFYFIRSKPGKVLFDELDMALEFGLLSEGPSLRVLEATLLSVYLPILMQVSCRIDPEKSSFFVPPSCLCGVE